MTLTLWTILISIWGGLWATMRWARLRTQTSTDYFLAARRVGPAMAALAQGSNTTVLWAQLVLVSSAYTYGAAAVWPAMAAVLGYILSWTYLGPRLRSVAIKQHSITVGQVFSVYLSQRRYRNVLLSLALIVLCAVLLMTAARLQIAVSLLQQQFPWTQPAILIAGGISVLMYLLGGGYWAASLVDAVLGMVGLLLMTAIALYLGWHTPAFNWFDTLRIQTTDNTWLFGHTGVVALAFALGLLGTGLAECGQPQVLNRFMSIKDQQALQNARRLALGVFFCAVLSALFVGWCARQVVPGLTMATVDLTLIRALLPEQLYSIAAILIAAQLLLGVGSTWLVAASAWVVDLRAPKQAGATSLHVARVAVVVIAILSVLSALKLSTAPITSFKLGWQLLGASLGPWLLVHLAGKRLRTGTTLGAVWIGFLLTLIFHAMPDTPGDFLEHVLPFVAGLGVVLTGGDRRSDPNRVDRRADERDK